MERNAEVLQIGDATRSFRHRACMEFFRSRQPRYEGDVSQLMLKHGTPCCEGDWVDVEDMQACKSC